LSKESRDLANQIKALNENIDLLIKVTAISVGKEFIFKGKTEAGDRIKALDGYHLPNKIIAMLIGSTEGSVISLRSQKKAKARAITGEVEFHAEDLDRILKNPSMFNSILDLIDFVNSVLQPQPNLSTFDQSQNELVQKVISIFQNSDRIKQALFIQALERRASDKALKDTDFLRFLEAWERHIRGRSSVESGN